MHRTVVVPNSCTGQGGVKMESFEPAGVSGDHKGLTVSLPLYYVYTHWCVYIYI